MACVAGADPQLLPDRLVDRDLAPLPTLLIALLIAARDTRLSGRVCIVAPGGDDPRGVDGPALPDPDHGRTADVDVAVGEARQDDDLRCDSPAPARTAPIDWRRPGR